MRSMTFALLGVLAAFVGAQAALAQNVPSSPPSTSPTLPQSPSTGERSSVPQAPIGHRQPTPKNLPPNTLSQEDLTGRRLR
jgi:hypothetical protein